jgi:transcriptional regulator with XRE-family HTH domain
LEQNEETRGSAVFGAYLRKVREGRRLSLDAVEELSAGFPEKVTKSHLSRIENGLALPTFPRLMAMSHIYGVPIASLAERYEIDLRRGMTPVDLQGKTDEDVLKEADEQFRAGEVAGALSVYWALFERRNEVSFAAPLLDARSFEVRIRVIVCLNLLGRYEYAKALVEETLAAPGAVEPQRLLLLQLLATASYRLKRSQIALLAIEECERGIKRVALDPRFHADTIALKANILTALCQPSDAVGLYRDAAERYTRIGNVYEAASARINLSEALGDIGDLTEARAIIGDVLRDLDPTAFERLRAMAYTAWAKIEFLAGNLDEADRLAAKSNLTARRVEHTALIFKNCFYLWRVAQAKQDLTAIRLNERTLRSYLGRIEGGDPEVEEFRGFIAREEQ